jgi:hypothetical protein
MKQFRSTGALFALVMLVVGYAYFFEYQGKIKKDAADAQAKKIISFSLEDTNEFSVKTFAEEYLFKKAEGQKKWILEKPITDVGSFAAIQGFLSQFGQETYEDVVAEGPSTDYGIYGLDDKDPKARITEVTFKTPSQNILIQIGSATAIAGKKYLRINKENKVVLAGYFWESQFQKSLGELREKNFVPPDYSLDKIEIKNEDHMTFIQKDGKWVIEELGAKAPDHAAIDDIYYQVKNLRATQIFKEGKNPQDLTNLGLNEPEIQIKIYGKSASEDKPIEILFSKNMAGQVYAITSDRNVIFSLNAPAVGVFKKGLEDFRDKKKPLSFNLADVQEMDFRSSLTSFKLKKENQAWISTENTPGLEVDNAKVVDILSKLSAMRVKKYFDTEIPYQKSGMSELKLRTSKGDKVLELEWSGRPVEDVFVAKSNLEQKTFGISMQDISSLPFQAVLVEPKKADANQEAKPQTQKLTQ